MSLTKKGKKTLAETMTKSLNRLRTRVDSLDARIVALLNARAGCCEKIGDEKRRIRADFHDPSREKIVMRRIVALNDGPLSRKAIQAIYRQIILECRELQVARKGRRPAARERKSTPGK